MVDDSTGERRTRSSEWDELLEELCTRSLDGKDFVKLYLDSTYVKARDGDVEARYDAVVSVTGLTPGQRVEILGFHVGDSEDRAFWFTVLINLRARGLGRVREVVSAYHGGLGDAIESVFPKARWVWYDDFVVPSLPPSDGAVGRHAANEPGDVA